jgi:hypothetical protein
VPQLADRREAGAVGVHHADPAVRLVDPSETAIFSPLGLQNGCSKLPRRVIARMFDPSIISCERNRRCRSACRQTRLLELPLEMRQAGAPLAQIRGI